MLNLLAIDSVTLTVTISVIAVLLLFGIVLLIGRKNFKPTAKNLAYVSVCIALTTVLSFIKFEFGFLNGGSITLFSLVPVFLITYKLGVYYGVITGLVTGLLQFITSPYAITPLSFFLDYVFPYGCIFLTPIFKKVIKNDTASLTLGVVTAYTARFFMHFLSGLSYYMQGYIAEGFPADNMYVYSLVYNAFYVLPDMVIALIFLVPFTFSKIFKKYFKEPELIK